MSVAEVFSVPASALLNPADSLLRARPLRTWSLMQQDAVRERLLALHRHWCAEWLRDGDGGGMDMSFDLRLADHGVAIEHLGDAFASWSLDPPRWRTSSNEHLAPERPCSPDDAVRAVAQRMFSHDISAVTRHGQEPARMAAALASVAWSDWLLKLQGLLGGGALSWAPAINDNEAQTVAAPWSGALWANWPWCGGTWHLVLSHDAVSVLLGMQQMSTPVVHAADFASGSKSKHALDQVLADQRVPLRVMLDGAQLSLGQLQVLRVGDVVTVRHSLDAPAHLVDMQGTRLCDAWLGQSEARVAVELTLLAAAT